MTVVDGSRADRLAAAVEGRELDALLVTNLVNVRYLTDFTGSNGLAIVGAGPDGTRRFITDFRYVAQASSQVGGRWERPEAPVDLLKAVAEGLQDAGVARLGVDDAHLTVKQHDRLAEAVGDGVELVAASGLVEELRAVKEPFELARIAAAAQLADEALTAVLSRGVAGRTEAEVALDLEFEMRRLGAQAAAFDAIVASGAHGALPHAVPRAVAIERGRLLTIDWGAQLDGYCSDCTRTFAVGDVTDDDALAVYDLVLRAQEAALAAVRPGPTGREVDAVAREIISAAGHGDDFGHGLGHGVGLEVHEEPRLSKVSGDDVLVEGHVVTVEPGVYVAGRHGVRIEDLAAVTADGSRVFSTLSKTLTELD